MDNFLSNNVAIVGVSIAGLTTAIVLFILLPRDGIVGPQARKTIIIVIIIIIIFISGSLFYTLFGSPAKTPRGTVTPTPASIASPTPSPQPNYQSSTALPDMLLAITWDTPAIKEQAIIIKATIQPRTQTPLQNRFGPGYDFFLSSRLDASGFTIDPKEQTQQSVDEPVLTFIWTAIPNYTDRQALALTINGVWIPQTGGNPLQRYLSSYSWYLTVLDNTPFFTLGQINFSTFLVVFLTPFLSIPVWELVKGRREAKQQKKTE